MKYENIVKGQFISRPNRFIAEVNIGGKKEVCHVKNTGRCKELLIPNCTVYLERSSNHERKTKYDLIAVQKGKMLVNIDSQAPNKVFGEWIENGEYLKDIIRIKPECKYKNSRFDFYIETKDRKIFAEIKGVTLEENGIVRFPDAPTERGVKHINELCDSVKSGYDAYIFFIVQMEECKYFTPNRNTHPEFADALITAQKCGVNVECLNCTVEPDKLNIKNFIDVRL